MSCLLLSSQLEGGRQRAGRAAAGDRRWWCVSAEEEWRKLGYNAKAMPLLPLRSTRLSLCPGSP